MSKTLERQGHQYPFATELITDIRGDVSKVVLRFQDYQALLTALEDQGLYRAMKKTSKETALDRETALTMLDRK